MSGTRSLAKQPEIRVELGSETVALATGSAWTIVVEIAAIFEIGAIEVDVTPPLEVELGAICLDVNPPLTVELGAICLDVTPPLEVALGAISLDVTPPLEVELGAICVALVRPDPGASVEKRRSRDGGL